MKSLNEAVENLIDSLWAIPSYIDLKSVYGTNELEKCIKSYLVSARFRKSRCDPDYSAFVDGYIDRCSHGGIPLRLLVLIGGYKQFGLRNAPYPDWAELFNLSFVFGLGVQLAANYSPGVEVVYRSDEVVMTLLSNYTLSDRQVYMRGLERMISFTNQQVPEGMALHFSTAYTSSSSTPSELFRLMDEFYETAETDFKRLPVSEQLKRTQVSYRNQRWNGSLDLSGLNEEERLDRSRTMAIMHEAFLRADVFLSRTFLNNGVSFSFRKNVPNALHYRSCKTSSVQFWAGEGIIVNKDGRYLPWIVSKNQIGRLERLSVHNIPSSPLGLESLRQIRTTGYTDEL